MSNSNQRILVDTQSQSMVCYEGERQIAHYIVSTAKNGLGEIQGSECTPRGWHRIADIIGCSYDLNSVFVSREWTGEIYTEELGKQFPDRDWILTRILRLDGLEEGRNKGGKVDTYNRYIYFHGTPHEHQLGKPGSHGCIRMSNRDIIQFADWAEVDARVHIK